MVSPRPDSVSDSAFVLPVAAESALRGLMCCRNELRARFKSGLEGFRGRWIDSRCHFPAQNPSSGRFDGVQSVSGKLWGWRKLGSDHVPFQPTDWNACWEQGGFEGEHALPALRLAFRLALLRSMWVPLWAKLLQTTVQQHQKSDFKGSRRRGCWTWAHLWSA
jgi:hypothetical protein